MSDSILNVTHSQHSDQQRRGTYSQVTGSREIFAILVKRQRHDAVGRVERFFHSVSVVDVDINVQNSLVISNITVQGNGQCEKHITLLICTI